MRPRTEDDLLCAHFMAIRRDAARALVPFLEGILSARWPSRWAGHACGCAYNWFAARTPELIVWRPPCPWRGSVLRPQAFMRRAGRIGWGRLHLSSCSRGGSSGASAATAARREGRAGLRWAGVQMCAMAGLWRQASPDPPVALAQAGPHRRPSAAEIHLSANRPFSTAITRPCRGCWSRRFRAMAAAMAPFHFRFAEFAGAGNSSITRISVSSFSASSSRPLLHRHAPIPPALLDHFAQQRQQVVIAHRAVFATAAGGRYRESP